MNILIGFVISILFICTVLFFVIIRLSYKNRQSVFDVVESALNGNVETKPADYLRTFEINDSGRKVLDHLNMLYSKNAYVKGGAEAERETNFRLGQQSVIDYIYYSIAKAKQSQIIENDGDDLNE